MKKNTGDNFAELNKHFKFSESEFWKNMVHKTYGLPTKEIKIGGEKVILYGRKELSNSPYITDGGIVSEEILTKENLNGITNPILLKYRSKLNISDEIQHHLVTDYFTYLLNLSGGKDEIWNKKVKSKTRNQVRKAQKTDYRVKIGKTELLDDFYKIISTAWRDLGTPTHSKNFYKNIVSEAEKAENYNAEFIILYVDDKPASVAILIFDEFSLHHPYAATLKNYNPLSLNNALYWEIITYAADKNIKFFDLGRSKKDQGTSTYKKSWGADEVQLYYYYLNKPNHKNEEEGKIVKLLIEIWKKLPFSVANLVGPKVIRNVLK